MGAICKIIYPLITQQKLKTIYNNELNTDMQHQNLIKNTKQTVHLYKNLFENIFIKQSPFILKNIHSITF